MKTSEVPRDVIEHFLRAHAAVGLEASEDGELLLRLSGDSYELREQGGKLLLHLWSEERNWVRRVAAIEGQGAGWLELRVERFGQRRPGTLRLATPRARSASEAERHSARRRYASYFRRLLQREFPRGRIESLSSSADLKNSFSGLYTRGVVAEGKTRWAVVGVNAAEDQSSVDGILTYGLIWLDWNRRRHPEQVFAGLRVYVPVGRSALTASRLLALNPAQGRVELFEVNPEENTCESVTPEVGNWDTRLLPNTWAAEVLRAEESSVARILALAPEVERVLAPTRAEVSLRIRGLEFARAACGEVWFGVGEQERLTAQSWAKLETLVRELARRRVPGGRADDPFYRLQPENWLESLVLRNLHTIDARLAGEYIYRQVPAFAAGARDVLDLLATTREGRLILLELKASSEIHLPLQALDYWQRVHWLQTRGELERFGYFPNRPLRPEPPELLLVAPAFQFHPSTEILLAYFAREIPLTLVGLNEDWRRGLQVVLRRTL